MSARRLRRRRSASELVVHSVGVTVLCAGAALSGWVSTTSSLPEHAASSIHIRIGPA